MEIREKERNEQIASATENKKALDPTDPHCHNFVKRPRATVS